MLQIYPMLRSIEYVRTTAGLTAKIVLALAVGAQRKARRLDIGKMSAVNKAQNWDENEKNVAMCSVAVVLMMTCSILLGLATWLWKI